MPFSSGLVLHIDLLSEILRPAKEILVLMIFLVYYLVKKCSFRLILFQILNLSQPHILSGPHHTQGVVVNVGFNLFTVVRVVSAAMNSFLGFIPIILSQLSR